MEDKPINCPSCSKESDIDAVEGCFQECLEKELRGGVKLSYPNVQCSGCSEEFDIADFEAHSEKCAVGEAQMVCLLCRKSFPTHAHADHMKIHVDEVCLLKIVKDHFGSMLKSDSKQV